MAGLLLSCPVVWRGTDGCLSYKCRRDPRRPPENNSFLLMGRGKRRVLGVMWRGCTGRKLQHSSKARRVSARLARPPPRRPAACRRASSVAPALPPPHSSFLSELLSAGLAGVARGILATTCGVGGQEVKAGRLSCRCAAPLFVHPPPAPRPTCGAHLAEVLVVDLGHLRARLVQRGVDLVLLLLVHLWG